MRRRYTIAIASSLLAAGAVAFAGAAAAADTTPPKPVTALTAAALSPTSIKLDWTNPTNADFAGVHICRALGATAPTLPCAGVNITKPTHTYTDTTQLAPNTRYTYSLFAYDTSANLSAGKQVGATTPPVPAPGNVTDLTATPLSPTSIELDWTNPTNADFAGVRICRGFGATAPTFPCAGVNLAAPAQTYTDTTQLVPNTQYTYSVFAFNTAAVTASGASVTVTTPPLSPPPPPGNVTGLRAKPLSPTSIKLVWTNPTDADFAGVRICRAYGATAPTLPCAGVNIAAPAHTFTDTNQLIPGTQYTYAVFAFSTSAAAASGASVTTATPPLS
jgi:chitodextrinase